MQTSLDDGQLVRLPYALKSWQKSVFYDPHRFKVICAGRRSGKTLLACDFLTIVASTTPNSLCWLVGQTYQSAQDAAWPLLKANLQSFFKHGLIRKVNESDLLIRFAGDGQIQLKGADKADTLRGPKLNALAVDEYASMRGNVWEEILQPMTSDLKAPAYFTSTPKGYNHFYELYNMAAKNPADWKSWHIKTSEAGTISPDEIERARRDMDPRAFRQEYEASFETFGGQVFTDFSRARNVTEEPIKFNPGMEYCLGVDFGWSAPTAVLFINVDAQENVFVWSELGRRETPIPVIGKHIIDAAAPARPTLIGCDPAGDAKNEALGTSSVSELRAIFSYEVVRYKHKYPGIIQDRVNQIRKWLRNGKLLISPTCTNLIQAFEMYRYPDPKGDIQSELPLKDGISDHWIDALGEFFINRFPVRKSSCGVA
jgi:hypothetical protein